MSENTFETPNNLLENLGEQCSVLDMGLIPTFHSRGVEQKAGNIQALMEEAIQFFKRRLDVDLDLVLFISDKRDFQELFEGPYGIPFIDETRSPHLVFMPCEEGAVLTGALDVEKRVSTDLKMKFKAIGYEYREAASTYVDLIALHEIGHAVSMKLGIGEINHWFNELMATYSAYAYMKTAYPAYGQIYMLMSEIFFKETRHFKWKTLEEFDCAYDQIPMEDPANYDWYQKKLNLLVKEIYDLYGMSFIKLVTDAFKGKTWSHEETMTQLKQMSPDIYQRMCHFNNEEEV